MIKNRLYFKCIVNAMIERARAIRQKTIEQYELDLYTYLSNRFNDITKEELDKFWNLYCDWEYGKTEMKSCDYIYNNW